MGRWDRKNFKVGLGKWLAGLAFFLLIWMSARRDAGASDTPFGIAFGQSVAGETAAVIYDQFMPLASLDSGSDGAFWIARHSIENILPLYGMTRRGVNGEDAELITSEQALRERAPGVLTYEELTESLYKNQEKRAQADMAGQERAGEEEYAPEERTDLEALLQAENEAASGRPAFVPHEQKMSVDLEELQSYETLVKTFYTIDANTMAGSDQLNVSKLLQKDMTVDKDVEGPQILIYHTHSQEAFADSVPGDERTGIMGVGEHLTEVLRDQYGYNVLHHTGQYDVKSRDNAYGNALPDLERILSENPSIQVVIDLHRDQMPEETKLSLDVDGRPTARFMFFNGVSRTKKTGDIAYLKNENIEDNLAFSFQMQLAAMEYYPGLTRKIYLKGYRYNMHVCPKSLLVELGAQNNTVEEAMNACEPLAHVLDLVIGGT